MLEIIKKHLLLILEFLKQNSIHIQIKRKSQEEVTKTFDINNLFWVTIILIIFAIGIIARHYKL